MAGNLETLRFVLFGDDRASSAFSRFARNVDDTTKAVDKNNVSLGDSKIKLDLIAKKAEELGRLNPDVKVQIDDYAAKLKLAVLKHELRDIGSGPITGGTGGLLGGLLGSAGSVGGSGASGLLGITATLPVIGEVGVPAMVALGVAAAGAALALAPVAAAIIPITLGFGTLAAVAVPELTKVFTALTAKGKDLKTALADLSPAERDIVQQGRSLKDQFLALGKAVQPEVLTAFGEAIKIIKDIFPALKPLVIAAGKALDTFLKQLSDWLESPQGQSFINWLKTVGPKDIANFGRVLWDVAKGVGTALHFIYSAGSWIDKFLTHWHDDWILIKTSAQIQWDYIKIGALKTVDFILGAFSHLPGPLGAPFRDARVAIHKDLDNILADVRRATGEYQRALDDLHGEKVTLKFSTVGTGPFAGKVTGFASGTSGARPGWAWVGEKGAELVKFTGGEKVLPHHVSRQVTRGYAAGTGWDISDVFTPPPAVFARALGEQAKRMMTAIISAVVKAAKATGLPGIGSGALGGDPAANMALARRTFPWPASQWSPFVSLEMSEAGFNRFAENPSSGAYGIPQALPPTKMPFAAQKAGGSHAGPQLSWMYSYIAGRYGNPASAWSWHLAHNWYDQGGWLPPGTSIATNNTGRPERVGGGGDIYIQNVTVYANDEGDLVRKLQSYQKRNGPIKLKVRS